MPQTDYAGKWDTRRVKLFEDEHVLRTSSAARYEILDVFYSFGALTLTNYRLIWTPSPYIADISPWTGTKRDFQDMPLVQDERLLYRSQRWTIRVETTKGTRRFGFGNAFDRRQKEKAEEWMEAIRDWKN